MVSSLLDIYIFHKDVWDNTLRSIFMQQHLWVSLLRPKFWVRNPNFRWQWQFRQENISDCSHDFHGHTTWKPWKENLTYIKRYDNVILYEEFRKCWQLWDFQQILQICTYFIYSLSLGNLSHCHTLTNILPLCHQAMSVSNYTNISAILANFI